MSGVKVIIENKKARFDYQVLDTLEAGIQLMGSEVKSLRNGQVTLKDAYVSFVQDEAFLQSAHISEYKASSYNNHSPERLRKLLLHREEIERMQAEVKEQGLTIIPLKLYFKKGRVKVLLGFAKGKKRGDKREDVKKRDAKKEMAQSLRKSR